MDGDVKPTEQRESENPVEVNKRDEELSAEELEQAAGGGTAASGKVEHQSISIEKTTDLSSAKLFQS